jgi:hypothetical protein
VIRLDRQRANRAEVAALQLRRLARQIRAVASGPQSPATVEMLMADRIEAAGALVRVRELTAQAGPQELNAARQAQLCRHAAQALSPEDLEAWADGWALRLDPDGGARSVAGPSEELPGCTVTNGQRIEIRGKLRYGFKPGEPEVSIELADMSHVARLSDAFSLFEDGIDNGIDNLAEGQPVRLVVEPLER